MNHHQQVDDKPILNVYLEPTSGTVLKLKDSLNDTIKLLLEYELIALRIHPQIYLNENSDNNLSVTIGQHLLSIAEHEPDLLQRYLDDVYNLEFITQLRDEESFNVVKILDIGEKELKKVENKASHYASHLITSTQAYKEKENHTLMDVSIQGEIYDIPIKDFSDSEKVLIHTIYDLIEDDVPKTNKIKELWPDIINSKEQVVKE